MMTFKDLTEKKDEYDTVTIKCKDREGVLKRLIDYLGEIGNVGHSFEIVVDQGYDTEKKFGWDGDGSAYIKSVEHIKSD